jgi:YfiR/HmsC-like
MGWQLVATATIALVCATALHSQNSPSEYQVKAAFLFNFAKFVEWPSDTFSNATAPIALCVFRHDPFGNALDEVIRGKTINNRDLVARRTRELSELRGCQVIFVDEREEKQLPEILAILKGASSLVVGEGTEFAERGGAIQFFLENNRLRFAINVDAVQRSRLQASSKLLALARIVHDGGHPKGS